MAIVTTRKVLTLPQLSSVFSSLLPSRRKKPVLEKRRKIRSAKRRKGRNVNAKNALNVKKQKGSRRRRKLVKPRQRLRPKRLPPPPLPQHKQEKLHHRRTSRPSLPTMRNLCKTFRRLAREKLRSLSLKM